MNGRGVHDLYVETHSWDASLRFYEALGFELEDGWGSQRDGLLRCSSGGPYVFLREVPGGAVDLAFSVVFAADDLDVVASEDGMVVARTKYEAGWGPSFIDVQDPDGRVSAVRQGDA